MLRRTTAVATASARIPLPASLLFPRRLLATATMASQTPMEDAIRSKVGLPPYPGWLCYIPILAVYYIPTEEGDL